MNLDNLFQPSPLSSYRSLTNGGTFNIDLDRDEASLILKTHDYGVSALDKSELALLDRIVSKMKDSVRG